jgi:hypothetical protein
MLRPRSLLATFALAGVCELIQAQGLSGTSDHTPPAQSCPDCGLNQTDSDGPYTCPLFPIMTFSGGTLYYCDYFESDCEDNPQPGYVAGNYDYPLNCPDCVEGSARAQSPDFVGLPRRASFGYASFSSVATDHRLLQALGVFSGQESANLRTEIVGVLSISLNDGDRYAVVMSVEFPDRPAGASARAGARQNRYVAFELDDISSEDRRNAIQASSAVALSGGKAYRARFTKGTKDSSVLVLLSRASQ